MRSRLVSTRSTWATFSVAAFAAALFVACGSDGSAFGDGSNNTANADGGPSGAFDPNGTNTGAGNGNVDPAAILDGGCAGTHAGLNGLPLHIVLVLDKSGSMCEFSPQGDCGRKDPVDCNCNNANSKWQQAKTALNAFFASQASAGITIDLISFGDVNDFGTSCNVNDYSTPNSSAAIPAEASKLASALNGITPAGGTPTNPALKGAVKYAEGLQQSLAGKANVSIILATDGEPTGCSNNNINDIAKTVGDVKDKIKSYIIGLGDNLTNLNTIAASAGTNNGKAFIVSAGSSLAKDLENALGTIRASVATCEYDLPAAPAGKVLDFNQVNVVYTTDSGQNLVAHSANCVDPNGWRYDDEAKPTKILLCTGMCGTIKGPAVKSVDVVLGCATSGGGIN